MMCLDQELLMEPNRPILPLHPGAITLGIYLYLWGHITSVKK